MLMRFFFFKDVHLMARNSKTTIQKHNKEKRPVISSFPFTQNSAIFQLMLFLVFKIKKKRENKIIKKKNRDLFDIFSQNFL